MTDNLDEAMLWALMNEALKLAQNETLDASQVPVSPVPSLSATSQSTSACDDGLHGYQVRDDDGYLCCSLCGQVLQHGQPFKATYDDTRRCGMRKETAYKPLFFFKEHLRRYLGESQCKQPLPLLLQRVFEGWPFCPNIYFRVKDKLKELGISKQYKFVYLIMYDIIKVPRPQMDSATVDLLCRDYMSLQEYFPRLKHTFGRKSMPSHSTVLRYLLHRHKHTPFFHLPSLKNWDRHTRIASMLQSVHDTYYADMLGRIQKSSYFGDSPFQSALSVLFTGQRRQFHSARLPPTPISGSALRANNTTPTPLFQR